VQRECTSDQASVGWNIEVDKLGLISTPHEIGEGGAKGAPLSGAGVAAAS